jgi:hypothetical protein
MEQNPKNDDEKIESMAVAVVSQATAGERLVLLRWAQILQSIINAPTSKTLKCKLAVQATMQFDVLFPIMRLIGSELKRLGWDDRGLPARVGLSAAAAALTLSGSGAGIAALGGAIGVPLWVVFGAGGTFVGVIIDELNKANK